MNCLNDCRDFTTATTSPIFQVQFELSNKTTYLEYTVDAFDQMIGIIGGFISLVWMGF
jgi:hypothetical protein